MNNQALISNIIKKADNAVKPQYYSTTRTYQDILRRVNHVKPVSETIKEFIRCKFSELK